MKYIALALLLVCGIMTAHAQSVSEGAVEYQRTKQPALITELPYEEDVVEKALLEFMAKKGHKSSDVRGFMVFRAYKLPGQENSCDVYFKLDRKSRKEKDVTTVYMVAGKNGEDLANRVGAGHTTLAGGKELLDEFRPVLEAYSLELNITAQEEAYKKAQRKFDNLVDDSVSLLKKKQSLELQLAQNKDSRDKQKAEVEKQQQILDAMKAKRKS